MTAADLPIEPGEGTAAAADDGAGAQAEATRSGLFAGRTAWARNLEAPLRAFLRTETGSAAILLVAAVTALVWVNASASSYDRVWTTSLAVRIGGSGVTQDLRHWVNDGLMT